MLSKIKLSFVIVLVLSLIPSSICQNWADFDTTADLDFDAFEGGQLEHVYSNLIKLEPVAPAS